MDGKTFVIHFSHTTETKASGFDHLNISQIPAFSPSFSLSLFDVKLPPSRQGLPDCFFTHRDLSTIFLPHLSLELYFVHITEMRSWVSTCQQASKDSPSRDKCLKSSMMSLLL